MPTLDPMASQTIALKYKLTLTPIPRLKHMLSTKAEIQKYIDYFQLNNIWSIPSTCFDNPPKIPTLPLLNYLTLINNCKGI